MRICFFIFILVANTTIAQTNKTYFNSRFGYQVTYPAATLKAQPESENKDGRIFNNKAGKERLRCWGRLNQNVDGETMSLKQRYNEDITQYTEDGSTITYKRYTDNFFVISGKNTDGNTFYVKVIARVEEDGFAYLLFTYPNKEKKTWEPLIKTIGASFK